MILEPTDMYNFIMDLINKTNESLMESFIPNFVFIQPWSAMTALSNYEQ